MPLPGLDLHQSTTMIRQIVQVLNRLGYGANPTPEVVYYSKPGDIEKPLSYLGPTPDPMGDNSPLGLWRRWEIGAREHHEAVRQR